MLNYGRLKDGITLHPVCDPDSALCNPHDFLFVYPESPRLLLFLLSFPYSANPIRFCLKSTVSVHEMCQVVAILGVNWTPFGNAYYITKECGGVPAPAGTDRYPRTQGFLGNLLPVQVAAVQVPVCTTARCETATFSIADWEATGRFGDGINRCQRFRPI